MKRIVLFASVPLAAVALAAGCTAGTATTSAANAPTPTTSATSTGAQAAPVSTHRAATPKTTATRTSDPGDGDHLFGAGPGDTALLRKIVKPCPNDGQKVIIQKALSTDVTGDGNNDLIVGRTCSSTTAYWESTVEVFDGRSTRTHPQRIATLLTDVGPTDAPWLAKLSAGGHVITVEAYGIDNDTTKACADIYFTYQYRYSNGSFKRTSRQVGNAATCPRVG